MIKLGYAIDCEHRSSHLQTKMHTDIPHSHDKHRAPTVATRRKHHDVGHTKYVDRRLD